MTKNTTVCKPQPDDEDGDFQGFLKAIRKHFQIVAHRPLFKVWIDDQDLFTIFLANLPPQYQAHYTCNCCRGFINKYGTLVSIDEEGKASSAIWTQDVPEAFQASVKAMLKVVNSGLVNRVFLSSECSYGQSVTGPWLHMAITPSSSSVYSNLIKTAGQASAEKTQDKGTLTRGLEEFSVETFEKAHVYLKSGGLYRAERYETWAKWALELKKDLAKKPAEIKENLLWLITAKAPEGWCKLRSGMLGTLLEGITAGESLETIKEKWATKMAPEQFQRAQVAPAAGNIAQAEKIIDKLRAAGSLDRRYARLDEIQLLWKDYKEEPQTEGVFSHLKAKPKKVPAVIEVPTSTKITWEKFQRTVLPEARKIEVQVPETSSSFMALVTASNPEAPPILQWDNPILRNPVSWYYQAGIDSEIRQRVVNAGGTYEGVDIRASLMWNNYDDLDLHVITPNRSHIYYANTRANDGWLDVDMNAGYGDTREPVENIRWLKGQAPKGQYVVSVYNFCNRENTNTPFVVEVEVNGDVFHFEGVCPRKETHVNKVIFEFDYTPGKKITGPTRKKDKTHWGLTPLSWASVAGISLSPNHWQEGNTNSGKHLFFLIGGCKDTSNKGRGFFTETLKGEFHSIRSTLEAFTKEQEIQGLEAASACGIGMSEQKKEWNLPLRVTTGDSVTTYTLDRWD